jgi:glycerol uptake facilitator-like aquaporin
VNINLVAAPDMLAIFVAELIFTFALVTAVFQTAVSKAANGNSYFGLAIGAVVIV